jgi:hypothetical protein
MFRVLLLVVLVSLSLTGCSSDNNRSAADLATGSFADGGPLDLGPPPDLTPRTAVLTQHNDSARTGANLAETVLTPASIQRGFGKLFSLPVDDQVFAQPLYVPDVAVAHLGVHDLVLVATVNNSVYAFDANSGARLWTTNFNQASGAVPVANVDVGQHCGNYQDFSGYLGIIGTPVIDRAAGTLFVVARTKEPGFVQRLHALALADGSERPGSPVVIQATVHGTGDGADDNQQIAFNPQTQNQRAALLLSGGAVVIAWASHCDTGPYHGWLMAYDAQSLAQVGVFNTTPNGGSGGIWQAGGGPVADAQGNIVVAAGNGDYDGIVNFGQSLLKLAPRSLTVIDWFTTSAWQTMNDNDSDFGSSGLILIPGTDYLAVGSKTGQLYVSRMGTLGKLVANDTQIIQEFLADPTTTGTNHLHGGPVFWDGPSGKLLYVWGENDYLRAYALSPSGFGVNTAYQSTMKPPDGMPGGILALSANGARDGVLWATHPTDGDANNNVRHGILRAFDAGDVSRELWNSMTAAGEDVGSFAKFVAPTVVNGKVYVASFSNSVVVYGTK